MSDLRSCPFCGCELYIHSYNAYKVILNDVDAPYHDMYALSCKGCRLKVIGFHTVEDAIKYVNILPFDPKNFTKTLKTDCLCPRHDIGYDMTEMCPECEKEIDTIMESLKEVLFGRHDRIKKILKKHFLDYPKEEKDVQ